MTDNTLQFSVVSIHGVPRSGTSWVGQIFDSHPNVAYRHQPLFAYRFKDRLSLKSTPDDISRFLKELYLIDDDDFILDVARRKLAPHFWLNAKKNPNPGVLVMKMVRYHHLLSLFLKSVENIKIIGIVRHPCAVINSWLQAPKEFRPGWNAKEEWRQAPKKNAGRIEEFNGFEKWKEVAQMFLQFEKECPRNFLIVQYENLVSAPENEATRLFNFVEIPMDQQTIEFIRLSHSKHDPDPYSILKDPHGYQRWRDELDPGIAFEILQELRHTELERFLV
jgi:hypothetical protein